VSHKVVVISGKQGSGKTTLAKLLIEKWKYAETIKFADPIYQIHDFAIRIVKEAGIPFDRVKDGDLLQYLGTEWGRKIDRDIWVKIAKSRIDFKLENYFDKPEILFIVDDCRFENEFNIFKDRALMIRLECPEEVRRVRAEYWREATNHPSEIGLDVYSADMKFDEYYATNVLTAEEISDKVIEILKTPAWELKYGKKI
jgi:dephospho-CoA kinase